jgi:predicted DNA-binding transcriptional regulator YafY
MNKTAILFDLIWYVNSKKEFTAKEVANEFNVSVRTAHRYITDLSDIGIPIYSKQGRNGGYVVLDNQVYPPILFSKDEIFAILFSFNYLGNYNNLPFNLSITSVKEKIYSLLPKGTLKEFKDLGDILQINEYRFKHDAPFLKEIITAAINKNIVLIQYNSSRLKTDKKVVPLGVYSYDGKWYSPALDIELMEYRLYRVDRIIDFKNSMDIYENLMSLKEWFFNYPINNPVNLYVQLNRAAYLECADIYFLQNDLKYINDNYYTLEKTIDLSEIPFYTKILLRLGINAKVIEPPELVNNLRREIKLMYSLYDINSK